jgi:hypothetical protein
MPWLEGEKLINAAETLIATLPKLKTRALPADWAQADFAVRRAVGARDFRRLDQALLAAMTHAPR